MRERTRRVWLDRNARLFHEIGGTETIFNLAFFITACHRIEKAAARFENISSSRKPVTRQKRGGDTVLSGPSCMQRLGHRGEGFAQTRPPPGLDGECAKQPFL